ncbi:Red-sensitive opsin-2 [Exaiptasia diaphana]|nr:Red-sensitive opsin-2 [Exaiptasia diaphana]
MGAFNEYHLDKSVYVAYGTVMFFILCLGLAGNLLSIPVLLHRDHRKKSVTSLMLNMCVVDVLLCSVGYSFIKGSSFPINDSNQAILKRQVETQKKMLRMTVAAVTVFFLSWAPYCIVSLMATAKGRPVLSGAASLFPELTAKSSVVFNPMVYTFMNSKFRFTLKNMLRLNYNAVSPVSTLVMENSSSNVGTPAATTNS